MHNPWINQEIQHRLAELRVMIDSLVRDAEANQDCRYTLLGLGLQLCDDLSHGMVQFEVLDALVTMLHEAVDEPQPEAMEPLQVSAA